MFDKVVIGGTFNTLHRGHKAVLDTGFEVGKTVVIGLTSDDFANRIRTTEVLNYEERKHNIIQYIKRFNKDYEIQKITDPYAIATIDPGVDAIVVSKETLMRAEEINAIRAKKCLDELTIIVVPTALAKDGRPISGNLIRKGEIDIDGNLL
ncbi:MAG: hypothetical protein A7315_10585 [Candidatus Altiarchaeales archaeon WOR_SM1_79]|nr:MAG: hypothetical protein A7315_10585 [Candidatus Altiarchaeales archaeon WOR_SM1_79]